MHIITGAIGHHGLDARCELCERGGVLSLPRPQPMRLVRWVLRLVLVVVVVLLLLLLLWMPWMPQMRPCLQWAQFITTLGSARLPL